MCISSRGVLKVTHMLTLAGGGLVPMEAPAVLGTFTSQVRSPTRRERWPCVTLDSAVGAAAASCQPPFILVCLQGSAHRTCVVQFVIMPHDEAAEQALPEDEAA